VVDGPHLHRPSAQRVGVFLMLHFTVRRSLVGPTDQHRRTAFTRIRQRRPRRRQTRRVAVLVHHEGDRVVVAADDDRRAGVGVDVEGRRRGVRLVRRGDAGGDGETGNQCDTGDGDHATVAGV